MPSQFLAVVEPELAVFLVGVDNPVDNSFTTDIIVLEGSYR
jgi:hypothetical protein